MELDRGGFGEPTGLDWGLGVAEKGGRLSGRVACKVTPRVLALHSRVDRQHTALNHRRRNLHKKETKKQ